ncbi:MAG: hypothetical protein H8E89_07930 [Candidatus Nitrosopelagicus sp.]|nr:hypothetical protein [Candidatus Nitrosopelagicus sp.]
MKMNIVIKEKINNLLHSDVVNYLETSERLTLKNILETDIITETETMNLEEILRKYRKFIKN